MDIKDNYFEQINSHISKMESSSKMGLNEKSYSRSLKANYVYSIISDMFIITMVTVMIWTLGLLFR